jgi:hypothetical protein
MFSENFGVGISKRMKQLIKQRSTFAFVASEFESNYEKTDRYCSCFLRMFEKAEIYFNDIYVVDGRMSVSEAQKVVNIADVVWLSGGDSPKQFAYLKEYGLDQIIKEHTGVKYARALETNGSFDLQKNLFRFQGTCYHHAEWEKMHALADSFLSIKSEEPQLFYIWGHAYEFDIFPERWALFEDFLRKISGRADIFYGTNKDVLLG